MWMMICKGILNMLSARSWCYTTGWELTAATSLCYFHMVIIALFCSQIVILGCRFPRHWSHSTLQWDTVSGHWVHTSGVMHTILCHRYMSWCLYHNIRPHLHAAVGC